MGNYDLGAALFAQKFHREIRMVRAPEPDTQSGAAPERIARSKAAKARSKSTTAREGALLSFDLLNALRQGEIVSIQGDRVIAGVAATVGQMFGQRSANAERAVHARAGRAGADLSALHRARRISSLSNHRARTDHASRAPARARRRYRARRLRNGARYCEKTIAQHWEQWFAFSPIFRGR